MPAIAIDPGRLILFRRIPQRAAFLHSMRP